MAVLTISSCRVRAGSRIRFECDYQNELDRPVVQGLSLEDDEMCIFSAFYYPAGEADEEGCKRMQENGLGSRTCAQTLSCLQLCPPGDRPRFDRGDPTVGTCFQKCITESCPNVATALYPDLECTDSACAAECATYGAECTACVSAHCKRELDACQAQPCAGPSTERTRQ
jgi:hypothetical protein